MIILSDNIKKDIQSNNTTLTYLVVISPDSEEPVYISSQKQMFEGNIWEDLNFKLSNIKERLDLVRRKFTINNVSFKLNNFKKDGKRISDLITEKTLMNEVVDIYYKTISCTTLDDCAKIYRGNIKSVKHDSKSFEVVLEDSTEDKLSKEVPMGNIGYRRAAYSKEYHNRPIPIVYGQVNKSPVIPIFDEALDENDSYSQNRIHIISDDTRSDRGISLGGYFSDEETNHIEQDSINPLYIYKGDYFQVLENWSDKCTIEEGLWGDSEQYWVLADELVVNKKFHKAEAVNPPANNEFECIKKRRPNDLQLLQNPSADDENELTQWDDSQGFGVRFTQESVLSPSSCFDSHDSVSQSSFFYSGNFSGVNESYTQIPNQTIPLQNDWDYLNVDFRPTHSSGIRNNFETSQDGLTERRNRWQGEVMSWLTRYGHLFNDEQDGEAGLVFIKLPSIELIHRTVNRKLWESFADDDGDLGDIYRWHNEQGLSFPEIVGASNTIPSYTGIDQFSEYGNASTRINTEANICGSMLSDWGLKSGMEFRHINSAYGGQDSNLLGKDFAVNFGMGIKYVSNEYQTFQGTIVEIPWSYFYYPATANSDNYYPYEPAVPPISDYIEYDGIFNYKFTYPKLRIQFKSTADTETNAYVSPVVDTFVNAATGENTTAEFNVLDLLPHKFVTIGLKSSNTTNYKSQGGSAFTEAEISPDRVEAKYFDLFDLEGFAGGGDGEGLFNADDFPQFKPLNLTNKIKEEGSNYIKPYYAAHWNGVTPQESPDLNYNQQYGTNIPYFGGYGRRGFTGQTRVKENEMLGGDSANNNDGWAVWVRNDIHPHGNTINIGEAVAGNSHDLEYNESALEKVEIKRHTLIPMLWDDYIY